MQLLLDSERVILKIGDSVETSEPFIFVTKLDRNYYALQGGKIVCEIEELPEGIKAQKHCYDTTTQEFTLNPTYIDQVTQTEAPKTFIEKVKNFFGY